MPQLHSYDVDYDVTLVDSAGTIIDHCRVLRPGHLRMTQVAVVRFVIHLQLAIKAMVQ